MDSSLVGPDQGLGVFNKYHRGLILGGFRLNLEEPT